MVLHIGGCKENVEARDPDTIDQAYHKAMKKIFARASFCNNISAYKENDQPENGFDFLWDKANRGHRHYQSEDRELKDEFPVHMVIFWFTVWSKRRRQRDKFRQEKPTINIEKLFAGIYFSNE
jgi:hypothetical protein